MSRFGLSRIVQSGEVKHLAGGGASEGPVWHHGNYLTFTRFRLSQLVRWDPTGYMQVIRRGTGNGNGCTIDREGRLVMCEGGNRRVTRTELNGKITTIAASWDGRLLNKPNDVVSRSDGSLYFTDPNALVDRDKRELDFAGVFRIAPDGGLHVATAECEYPNGLAFSPDESILYVAISGRDEQCRQEVRGGKECHHRAIRALDVSEDGSLSDGRLFADMTSSGRGAPDGVKVDIEGRVYCAGSGGIWVFEPSGEKIGIIRVRGPARNLAFGGQQMSTLFISAGSGLHSIELKVRGIGPPPVWRPSSGGIGPR